jgi:hypothetical protein
MMYINGGGKAMWKAGPILMAALAAAGHGSATAGGLGGLSWPGSPTDALAYIQKAIEESPIVALGEGPHASAEPHEFLRYVLSNEEVLRAVDVIIVEFATELQQPVLDSYISGEDVSFGALSKVWRDTSTSPIAPWDSPLYVDLLAGIREANQALPEDQRVRVLAGDPPMDWASIATREDFSRAIQPRDFYVARVAIEQAFELGKKVLIVYGGAHLPRVPVGDKDDMRNSLTYRILERHPNSMRVLEFLNSENLGLADRIDEFVPGTVYETGEHWVGEMNAERFFPGIRSRVTDPETGEASWQEVPLYSGHSIQDLFDALVYIGPSSEWHHVPPSLDEERDAAYLRELDRRRRIRFGERTPTEE